MTRRLEVSDIKMDETNRIPCAQSSQLGVVLIDAQPGFWEYAYPGGEAGREPVMVRLEHLLALADWLELPVVATFEDPVARHGQLPERLEA